MMTQNPIQTHHQADKKLSQASFFGYEDGSSGPVFFMTNANNVQKDSGAWPCWIDELPVTSDERRAEGGLRTQGKMKSSTPQMPLISFVTVVRNNNTTLERTIESVQKQTYSNVEHIVLDGASTDGTLDIILRYADYLDYFVSEPDVGLYDAINKALPLSRGQLICILNSDDWLEPNAAEIVIKHMSRDEGNCVLLTAAKVLDGQVVHHWSPAFIHPGSYFMCANDCHNGMYATRLAYEKSGPYDSTYKIAADFKWIMNCMDAGAVFIYTQEATVNYSLGGTSSDFLKHSMECMKIVQERFPFLSPTEVRGLYHSFFVFTNTTTPYNLDRPANLTIFLRELLARHGMCLDFVNALGWASVVKLDHPSDRNQIGNLVTRYFIKDSIKRKLLNYPRLYRFAVRLYLLILKR